VKGGVGVGNRQYIGDCGEAANRKERMLIALSILIGGLTVLVVILAVRWVEALLWRRQLVAYLAGRSEG